MTELEDLKSFVEVVESGGFSRAAVRLGVSKSIVSRRIARLEAELGTRLLNRTTRGLSATEAGLEFKARSERILAELDEAREAVARQGSGAVGRLRVSVPLSFGIRHVAPVLADLARHHPGLELDVSYTDRRVDLVAEGFDAALRIGTLPDSTLVARRLAPVRAALAASPDYLARHGTPRVPADLARHECLIYTGSSVAELQFRSGKRTVSIRPHGRLRSDSGEAILQWAIAGLGVADLPTFLLADAFESGALKPLLLDYEQPEAGIYALRPPGAHVPGKVRVLVDALVERFGGAPDWDRCLMAGNRMIEQESSKRSTRRAR
jgi:DNA-binding transcriptional LysR family regulator